MNLIQRDRFPHWYAVSKTGAISACYEVPKADGIGTTKTTLAHARKMGLLVGISAVANVMPKYALQSWKIEQALLAALTLPRLHEEALDAYALRVVADMDEKSRVARERGTEIHQAIEDHLNGIQRMPEHLKPYLGGFMDWAAKNIEDLHALELTVGDPALGIAGRMDIDCTLKGFGRTILDPKTQGVKKEPVFYDEWAVQLAAYEHCIRREDGIPRQVASVIINSTKPDEPHVKMWLGAKEEGWRIFTHCLALWCWANNFNPANPQPKDAAV